MSNVEVILSEQFLNQKYESDAARQEAIDQAKSCIMSLLFADSKTEKFIRNGHLDTGSALRVVHEGKEYTIPFLTLYFSKYKHSDALKYEMLNKMPLFRDPNGEDSGCHSPLEFAAWNNCHEMHQLLGNRNINPNVACDSDAFTKISFNQLTGDILLKRTKNSLKIFDQKADGFYRPANSVLEYLCAYLDNPYGFEGETIIDVVQRYADCVVALINAGALIDPYSLKVLTQKPNKENQKFADEFKTLREFIKSIRQRHEDVVNGTVAAQDVQVKDIKHAYALSALSDKGFSALYDRAEREPEFLARLETLLPALPQWLQSEVKPAIDILKPKDAAFDWVSRVTHKPREASAWDRGKT